MSVPLMSLTLILTQFCVCFSCTVCLWCPLTLIVTLVCGCFSQYVADVPDANSPVRGAREDLLVGDHEALDASLVAGEQALQGPALGVIRSHARVPASSVHCTVYVVLLLSSIIVRVFASSVHCTVYALSLPSSIIARVLASTVHCTV